MTWKAFHNRGETLRAVIATASVRRDGILPMDVDGVAETFADELDLLGTLQLKWHTRLSGRIERAFADQPLDLTGAVARAWSDLAEDMAGVRLILDHYRAHPVDETMRTVMAKAEAKEHMYLALTAGRASRNGDAARRVGAEIEEQARLLHAGRPVVAEVESKPLTLLDRLRAVIAA